MTAAPVDNESSPARARVIKSPDYTPEGFAALAVVGSWAETHYG